MATLLIFFFFYYKVSVWKLQISVREEENIFYEKVYVVKNKNLEDVAVEQLQAEARCIVQHPGFEETGES